MKLLTWNVQWFCGIDGRVSVERVIARARELVDFDVLCLQEVAVDYPQLDGNAGFDQVARVRALLPGFEVGFGAAVDELGRHGRRQRFGNLLATRLPLWQVQHYPLPYPPDPGVSTMPRVCTCATLQAAFGPVRVMTTHLEFSSRRQRMAQASALAALHAQDCAQADGPPLETQDGSPYQTKRRTLDAVLCGDFNLTPDDAEYALIQAPPQPPATRLRDAWTLAHGMAPHAPTFCVHEQRYRPAPLACDFFFVSETLAHRVRRVAVDATSQASDHQPLWLELA